MLKQHKSIILLLKEDKKNLITDNFKLERKLKWNMASSNSKTMKQYLLEKYHQ